MEKKKSYLEEIKKAFNKMIDMKGKRKHIVKKKENAK